jgi:hypothetical protein
VFRLHPLIEGGEAVLREQDVVGCLEILEGVEPLAGMAQEHLRVLLEMRRDDHRRNVLLDRREGLDHAAAHVEVELADRHEHAVAGAGPARHDRDLQAVLFIGPIGHGLVESAVLSLRNPVGAKGHFGKGLLRQGAACSPAETRRHHSRQACTQLHPQQFPCSARAPAVQPRFCALVRGLARPAAATAPSGPDHSTDQG